MSRLSVALGLAFVVASSGCGEEFDPASRLTSLRVLALQSEPVAPATDETTTLTPLIYTPPGVTVDGYTWSWCPFVGSASDGYPCLVDEEALADLGGDGEIPAFDLGEGETATFTNSLDPALLAAVCEGSEDQPALIDCHGGFPVTVRMSVTADDERVDVVRELRLRFRPEDEPNANPTIDGLVAELDDGDEAIDDLAEVTLRRREEQVVRAEVPEAVVEEYTGRDDAGEPVDARERWDPLESTCRHASLSIL